MLENAASSVLAQLRNGLLGPRKLAGMEAACVGGEGAGRNCPSYPRAALSSAVGQLLTN
jgi:hypothetical protein